MYRVTIMTPDYQNKNQHYQIPADSCCAQLWNDAATVRGLAEVYQLRTWVWVWASRAATKLFGTRRLPHLPVNAVLASDH
jgi:hypothetical protein